MQRRFFPTLTLLAFLTACGQATATPTTVPTLTVTRVSTSTIKPRVPPTETSTSTPTVENSATPAFTPTLEPTQPATMVPIPSPSLPPTPTATLLPQPAAGSGAIQFLSPGPLSKLVSPMIIYGYAIPGYGAQGRAALYGEDGRLLAAKLLQLNTAYTWAYYYGTLSFEVQGAGEFGRLTITTQDQYGRFTAANSVHLILLPEGLSIVNAPGNVKERCVIEKPAAGRRISGGSVTIAGGMRPFNRLPVAIQLIDRDGKVIASQAVEIQPAADDSYVPFQVTLPYSIPRGAWALMVVSQPDDRIDGLMYLFSREIFLNP